jgi:hypothetical protein
LRGRRDSGERNTVRDGRREGNGGGWETWEGGGEREDRGWGKVDKQRAEAERWDTMKETEGKRQMRRSVEVQPERDRQKGRDSGKRRDWIDREWDTAWTRDREGDRREDRSDTEEKPKSETQSRKETKGKYRGRDTDGKKEVRDRRKYTKGEIEEETEGKRQRGR